MSEQLRQAVRRVGAFLAEVGQEFRRTTWPARGELVESTGVVVALIVILAVIVLVCDRVIHFLLRLVHA
jgi:preprotein translocase SecE subunit